MVQSKHIFAVLLKYQKSWIVSCLTQRFQHQGLLAKIIFKRYMNSTITSQSVYNQIIPKIRRIYEGYEERANQLAEDKRVKTGTKTDKIEEDFLRQLTMLEENMSSLVGEMKKHEKGSTPDYRQHQMVIDDCLKDLRSILKKKPLNFKINPQIRQIIEDTDASLIAIRKDLVTVKDTKFLCCGTDGAKKFRTPMNYFKIVAGKWKMLTLFEPKDGIQTFVSPKFSEAQYAFIGEVLKSKWPQQKVMQPIIKEVEVIKEVYKTSGAKPNRLHEANQFIYGINREENIVQGLAIYHDEADAGNPQACTFLATSYQEGVLLPADANKAIAYYKKAISGKEPYATYRYALALIRGRFSPSGQNKEDIQRAFDMLTQISNDSPQAMAELGEIYEFGSFQSDPKKLLVIKKDERKARAFYERAKNLNLSRASNNLAVLLLNNRLAEKEGKSQASASVAGEGDRTIVALLTQAQEEGFSQAFYNLGVIYSRGLLGQRDPERALKLFYEGSLKGDYKCKIQFAYQLMNQTSILKEEYEDHYHLAIHWLQSVLRKTSLDDHPAAPANSHPVLKADRGEALFYLGVFHEHGFGVEKSPKKAISYFIESAECDYPPAKNKIGDCYFSGYGIKQDRQLAVGCYLEAAELKNSDAMVNLGTVYLNGLPGLVERSYKKAYQYFLAAHELENTDAMIHLSYMYRNGLGVETNQTVARELLEQAAQLRNATALYMLREQGLEFNEGILFEHLENEFFSAPKKINMKEVVPVVSSTFRK